MSALCEVFDQCERATVAAAVPLLGVNEDNEHFVAACNVHTSDCVAFVIAQNVAGGDQRDRQRDAKKSYSSATKKTRLDSAVPASDESRRAR